MKNPAQRQEQNHVADYAIGDVQGCFDALQRLLDKIQFNDREDRLWFVGDLVNRGPKSLDVLRFIKHLPIKPQISLGNHDLHLLNIVLTHNHRTYDASLQQIIDADDCEELCDWLRHQKLLCWDSDLNVLMCHAGVAPMWTIDEARSYAQELEQALAGPEHIDFLNHMYGNTPNKWSPTLTGMPRLRAICNYLTRMRFCFADGSLEFEHQGQPNDVAGELYPWFAVPNRIELNADVIFGHWAALEGRCAHPKLYALDTGYVWGGALTALRLQDKYKISVPAQGR